MYRTSSKVLNERSYGDSSYFITDFYKDLAIVSNI